MKIRIKTVLFIILVVLTAFSAIFQTKFILFGTNHEIILKSKNTLKKADFWELIGTSIYIDDTDPNFNWSKTAADNDWCRGTGTLNDPYIIENVTIDTFYISSSIEIRNSRKFFKIQSCFIYNSGSDSWDGGISLYNTSRGEITDCQLLNHNMNSILIRDSINITITNNFIRNSLMGIRLFDTNNSVIKGNSLFNIFSQGIALIRSFENLVKNNKIINSPSHHCYLFLLDSSDNSILGNLIGGVYLWDLDTPYGIDMWNSQSNIIRENIFVLISLAILLDSDCSNNLIYKNYFNAFVTVPCFDNGLNNDWDNGIIGNYWSGYHGNDNNHNGIGDTPFNFGTGIDSYPIWREAPDLNVDPPQHGETYIEPPMYNVEITGGHEIDSVYYTLNYTEKKYFITNSSVIIDSDAWYALPNGPLDIVFSANDSFGLQYNFRISLVKIPSPFDPTPLIISGIIALIVVVTSGIFIRRKLVIRKN